VGLRWHEQHLSVHRVVIVGVDREWHRYDQGRCDPRPRSMAWRMPTGLRAANPADARLIAKLPYSAVVGRPSAVVEATPCAAGVVAR